MKKCQQLLPTGKQLSFAVSNIRSARNKADVIIDDAMGNKMTFVCSLRHGLKVKILLVLLSSLSPPGYLFHNIVLDLRSALEVVLE